MIAIDLSGPDGNVFALRARAKSLAAELGLAGLRFPRYDISYEAFLDWFDATFAKRVDYRFVHDPRGDAPGRL